MQRIRPRLLSLSFRFCLMLFVLTPWTGASYAQPELSPSEQYPGPWAEVSQEVRDLLALRKISACSEAAGRQSSRNPNEYLLYCTSRRETLDKLARTARYPQSARTRQTLRRDPSTQRLLMCRLRRCPLWMTSGHSVMSFRPIPSRGRCCVSASSHRARFA